LIDEEVSGLLANQPWAKYSKNLKNGEYHSELLKISQFFDIPPHNANAEGDFSLMQAQWTTERNMLNVESLRRLLCLSKIFIGIYFAEFRTFLKNNVLYNC
jgi:hypothetical protein